MVLFHHRGKSVDKALSIVIVSGNGFALVAAGGHMIDGTGIGDPKRASHNR
jgi:hypothetical protein